MKKQAKLTPTTKTPHKKARSHVTDPRDSSHKHQNPLIRSPPSTSTVDYTPEPKIPTYKSPPKDLTQCTHFVTVLHPDIPFPLSALSPTLMAGEEINPPASLPPYTEMIFAAIDALKQKDGLTESSISNYIESTCGSLPDDHTNILADQLNKLVDDGELVVLNNNYMRPDSTVPAKRGRGRPPKAKTLAVPESPPPADAQTPAPADAQAPAPAQAAADAPAPVPALAEPGSEVKRGRGRPRKDPNAPPSAKKVKVDSVATPPSKTGRPRGRPRKEQPELAGVEAI